MQGPFGGPFDPSEAIPVTVYRLPDAFEFRWIVRPRVAPPGTRMDFFRLHTLKLYMRSHTLARSQESSKYLVILTPAVLHFIHLMFIFYQLNSLIGMYLAERKLLT